jgi:succinate dehydrogenase hydrophobic anchor subunit
MQPHNRFTQTPRANWNWLWQAISGAGLIALVGLHMIAHHFVAPGGIRDFAGVADYLRNPLIVVLEVAFLIAVTAHALLGVRAILFDLGLSARTETNITRGLTVIGVLTVVYGIWLTWTITHAIA